MAEVKSPVAVTSPLFDETPDERSARLQAEVHEARRSAAVNEHKMRAAEQRAVDLQERLAALQNQLTLAKHQMGAARPTRMPGARLTTSASGSELLSTSFASNASSGQGKLFDEAKWAEINDKYRPTSMGDGRATTPSWQPKSTTRLKHQQARWPFY